MDFSPGCPLPDPSISQERTLYHAPRQSGETATMTHEAGTWQWRQLRGNGPDVHGSGGWNELQRWLAQGWAQT